MKPRSVQGRDAGHGDVITVSFDSERILSVDRHSDSTKAIPILSAGLVDAQVNGFRGSDVNGFGASSEAIQSITADLATIGVTTWSPTIITASEEAIVESLRCIESARQADPLVAKAIPSVHIEGPFISDRDGPRGVHDVERIRSINMAEVQRWQVVGVRIGVVTVSPHDSDSPLRVSELCALGITVAIGHTHATPEQITAAVDAGATVSTHLGNGIELMVRRHPNPMWTQLAEDRLVCGLIADGHHLPDETLEVMLRAKGTRGAFLVSDSTAMAGMSPGRYETAVGGVVDLSSDGRLSHPESGLLAGAAKSLPEGFQHVLRVTSVGFAQGLRLVTENPARIIPGARAGLGMLRVGAPSDFVLMDDSGGVLEVIQSGTRIGSV